MTRVLEVIDAIAAERSEALAVAGPDGTLTYAELSARGDAVAQRLGALGVRPGDRVGLCLPRSAALVAGALGIMRAGAAFVAIDPAYPEERVRWMLADAGVTAVVSDAGVEAGPGGGPPPDPEVAYVVYTSGSTGEPKGVPVEHAGLANLIRLARDGLRPLRRGPLHADREPRFDATVWEVWPVLAAGASLHVVPDALRGDPIGLRDWLVAERVTVSFMPTAVAQGLIGLAWPEGRTAAPPHGRRRADDATRARPPLHRRQQLRAQRDSGGRHVRARRRAGHRRADHRPADQRCRGGGRRRGRATRGTRRRGRARRGAASRSARATSAAPSSPRSASWSTGAAAATARVTASAGARTASSSSSAASTTS